MNGDEITKLLASKRTADRMRGVEALARYTGDDRETLLLRALANPTGYVAERAAALLEDDVSMATLAAMNARFLWISEDGPKRDPGCHVRARLAFAFGKQDYMPAADALRVGIRTVQIEAVGGVPFDTAAHLRANCALALAQTRAADCVRDISLLLFDMGGFSGAAGRGGLDQAAVKVEPRKAAAAALALTGDPAALVPLTLKLAHPGNEKGEVLQQVMQAVIDLEDERAVEFLAPYLENADSHLAAFAALSLARTGRPEVPALIVGALGGLSGDPLRGAVLALSTMRCPEARPALHSLAEHDREAARLALVEALTSAADPADRALLQRLARADTSPKVKRAAQDALK